MLAVSKQSGPLDLPGHRVNRVGETIVLTNREGRPPRRRSVNAERAKAGVAGTFEYQLAVPGHVRVPEAACAIVAEAHTIASDEPAAARWPLTSRGDRVVVEGAGIQGPLVVRNRRPGDRFRPLGLQGRKKLQDFFVDEKVLRSERDAVPLVVDSKGQIVWVAGLSVAEDFRVTDRTKAVVILKRQPF